MKIYKPIRNSSISQHFGENRACKYPNGTIVGKRGNLCPGNSVDFYKSIGMLGHNGTDWACPYRAVDYFNVEADTKWEARYDGDFAGGLGLDIYSLSPIEIKNASKILGQEALAYYKEKGWYDEVEDDCLCYIKRRGWHYDQFLVKDGEEVWVGKALAHCDSTGSSSNDHLHENYKIVDENRNSLDKDNGYFGAFKLPFSNEFVLDYLKKKGNLVDEIPMTTADHLYYVAWLFVGTGIERIFERVGKSL